MLCRLQGVGPEQRTVAKPGPDQEDGKSVVCRSDREPENHYNRMTLYREYTSKHFPPSLFFVSHPVWPLGKLFLPSSTVSSSPKHLRSEVISPSGKHL